MPQIGRQFSGLQDGRRVSRSLLHSFSLLILLTVLVVLIAACGGVNDSGTHPDFVETQRAGQTGDTGGHGSEATEPASASPTEPAGGATEPIGAATEPAGGGEDLAALGKEIAATNACTGCHSIDGSVSAGPSWQGLWGHEVTLEDGSTVTADEAYITESIHDPGAKIVKDFTNIMPATYANMPADQIAALIAYIQTLK